MIKQHTLNLTPKFIFQLVLALSISLISCQQTNNSETNNVHETEEKSVEQGQPDTDIALNFINGYVANCNKMSEAESAMDWVHPNMTVSVSFKNELNQMMEEAYETDPEMGLGFDPIFNAQDYPQEGFELESVDPKTGNVTVAGKDWKEFKLVIRLIYDREWLVDGCGAVNMSSGK